MNTGLSFESTVAVVLLVMFTGLEAQPTSAGTPPETAASPDTTQLEEIVVTTTRRAQSIDKVPISIEALGQDQLSAGGIKSIADIAATTPGLQFARPSGFATTLTTISMRGMNTNTGASTVGIYLDDTPIQGRLSSAGAIGSPFPVVFDLNRVEVARGPQGTLFGAGSEAGTVRFITNDPSVTEFSGFSHAEIGSTQGGNSSYEIGAAGGGPIVQDTLGFRLSAWHRRDGGYVDRIDPVTGNVVQPDANQSGTTALRAALAVVAAGVRITPSVYYQEADSDDSNRFYGNFSDASQGRFINGKLLPELSTDRFVVPSLKVEAELPFAQLTSNTSYMHREVKGSLDASALIGAVGPTIGLPNGYGSPLGIAFPTTGADVAPTTIGQRIKGITEEARLASTDPDAFIGWVAGVFYDHRIQQDYQITYSQIVDPTGARVLDTNQHVIDDQVAIFAQGDFHLTKALTATVGARFARVESNLRADTGPGFFDFGIPPVSQATLKETPFTPRVALSYQANSNNLFYASVGKGYRLGGGNQAVPDYCNFTAPTTYKSDSVWSYEVGAKDKLFGGRMEVDSSAFHINWSQIQQQIYLPCGLTYNANTGSAVSNGFDLDVRARVTDYLRFDLSAGYVDAYFTRDVFDQAGAPLVLKDDKVGLLPQVNSPWNVNLAVNQEIPLGNALLHARAEYQYQSRNPGPFSTQIATSSSYYPLIVADPPTHILNLRIGLTKEQLDVSVFVQNALNSHPLLGKFQDSAVSNLVTYSTFRPRTVGLAANFDFK